MSDSIHRLVKCRADANCCVTQKKGDEAFAEFVPPASRADFELRRRHARNAPAKALQAEKLVIGRSRAEHDGASLIPSFIAYEAAGALKISMEEWRKFASDPLWQDFGGHKPDPQKSAEHLRWAMNFVHEAKDRRGKDRANVYRGALQAKFEQGAEVETLFAFIKDQGGIDAAYRNAPRSPSPAKDGAAPNAKKGKSNSEDTTGEDQGDKSSGVTSNSEKGSSGSNSSESSTSTSDSPSCSASASSVEDPVHNELIQLLREKAIETKTIGLEPLLIALTPHDFARVRLRRLPINGELHLRCKIIRSADDGWVAVTCSKVWRPSSKS